MAKLAVDLPMNLEKINPKSGPLRRNSTGNAIIKSSEPKPIPNYLRASTGSCHDLCKYGVRRDFPDEPRSLLSPKQRKDKSMVLEERSKTNYREKKASGMKNLVPLPSPRQHVQPSRELKPRPLVRSDQSAVNKQTSKTFAKITSNQQISRNDADKGLRASEASKKSSSLPLTSSSFSGSSSVKVPSVGIRTSGNFRKKVSLFEIKKSVENSEAFEKTSSENVPEKIIHVVEPNDENRNEDLAQDGNNCTTFNSIPNQKQKLDSEAESRSRSIRTNETVVPKQNDSSPRKLKIKREKKVVEIENGEAGSKGKSLRRVVSYGEIVHQKNESRGGVLRRRQAVEQKNTNPDLMNTVIEETASKLTKMNKSKVKALVDAFETVINIQDSESSRTYARSG